MEGQKRLRHVEGDVSLCLKIKNEEKTNKDGREDGQDMISSSMGLHQKKRKADLKEVTVTVLQKNTKSLKSNERMEDFFFFQ